jgi:DNA primase
LQMDTKLLQKSPDLAYEIEDLSGLQRIQIAGVDRLIVLIQTLKKKPTMGIGELLSEWEDPSARQAIAELAATELFIPPTGYREEFNGAIERLLSQAQSKTTQGLIHKSRTQGLSSDERDQLATLLSEKKNEDNVL